MCIAFFKEKKKEENVEGPFRSDKYGLYRLLPPTSFSCVILRLDAVLDTRMNGA